jgi:Flp pilus assembly protein TadG
MLLPLLLLMLVGATDFARLFYDGIAVTNAARAGVQFGTLNKTNSGDTAGMIQAATGDVEGVSGVSVTAERYCACPDGTRIDCVTGTCGLSRKTPDIIVKVTAQKTFQTLFQYPGIPHTITLKRDAIVRAR